MTTSGRSLLFAAAAIVTFTPAATGGQTPAAGTAGAEVAIATPQPASSSKPKKKKPRVEFLWVPHPSLRAGKQVRVDFRARVAAEKHYSDASATAQPGLDRARRKLTV